MAVYAVGDLQGCRVALERLLDALHFEPQRDRLWLVGDLVNRGPDSLGTLRLVRALGESCISVLGNHDLHLLAVWHGVRVVKSTDTFDEILGAADAAELLDWLRHRPLLHHDAELGVSMSHAGLHPHWDLPTAQALAAEVEGILRSEQRQMLFDAMYADQPRCWDPALRGAERWRFAINAFTRMRYCRADGWMDFKHKGRPGTQPAELMPWFRVPGRRHAGLRIVFGHWSTVGAVDEHGVHALDAGCVWGGQLVALRLDDGRWQRIAVDCRHLREGG